MRLIGHVNGIVAYRVPLEEYQPLVGALPHDLIPLVQNRYQFQTFPIFTPGDQLPNIFSFAIGRFPSETDSFAISQLVMMQDGDIAAAVLTEQAERVLDDLARLLDENLGYRLQTAKRAKSYASNLVVQFDQGLEQYIDKLSRMASVINDLRPNAVRFNIKRLGFGTVDVAPPALNNPLLAVEKIEFQIERRVMQPFEENRYFCSAPLSSIDHVRALEQIEAIARGEAN
jgi:hypothetical protein